MKSPRKRGTTCAWRMNWSFLRAAGWHKRFPDIMSSVSIRCRLEDRTLPGVVFGLVVMLILLKVGVGLYRNREVDVLECLLHFALAGGLFYSLVSGRCSLWSMVEVPAGIRMERDGVVLYEGPASGLRIVDEDRGVMTLRSGEGSAFLFPRRRVFHAVISRFAAESQASGASKDSTAGLSGCGLDARSVIRGSEE